MKNVGVNLQHVTTFRRWSTHWQLSRAIPVSPKRGGRTVGNTSLENVSAAHSHKFVKREGHVAGVRRTRKRVAPVGRTVAVSPQSFSPCKVHGISFTWLPAGPAARHPALTPRGASVVLVERFATLTALRPGLGTAAAHHVWPLFAYTMRINL